MERIRQSRERSSGDPDPSETVTDTNKDGKHASARRRASRHLFVEMEMSEHAWHVVKDTPKVTAHGNHALKK